MTSPEDPTGFAIHAGEPVDEAVRRIAREQIDGAVKRIDRGKPDDPRTVHELRKSCKRIRSLMRLVRGELERSGTFARENAVLRDLARQFSSLRDADVALATYDMLMAGASPRLDRRAFAPIRRALVRQRRAVLDSLDLDIAVLLRQARADLLAFRGRVDKWSLKRKGFKAIAPGLRKTYNRAYRRRREALSTLDIEVMHEWRKRTKYHRHHLRLIRFIWPPLIEARHQEADRLGELLGDERDLRLLRDKVAKEHDTFGRIRARQRFVRYVDRRRAAMRQEAFALGKRLFAEPPETYLRSVRTWWDTCEAERAAEERRRRAGRRPPRKGHRRAAPHKRSAGEGDASGQRPIRTPEKVERSPDPLSPSAGEAGKVNGHDHRRGSPHAVISLQEVMEGDADMVRPGEDENSLGRGRPGRR